MIKEFNSQHSIIWNLKFRDKIINFLKHNKVVNKQFYNLEKLHERIPRDMTIDNDWPSGVNEITTLLYDIDWEVTYKNFIHYLYTVLKYDFYFQKEPNVRVHCPQPQYKNTNFRYWHNDSEKGHPPQELNIWMSLTENNECSFELLDKNNVVKEIDSNLQSFLFFDDGSDEVMKHSYRPVVNETRVSIETRINPKDKYVEGFVGSGRMKAEFKPGGHFGYDIKLASEIYDEI